MLRTVTADMENVEVDCVRGLLADYASEKHAAAIVKGLRAISDFEYEFQMALANKKLNTELDTVFLMTDQKYLFLSSTIGARYCPPRRRHQRVCFGRSSGGYFEKTRSHTSEQWITMPIKTSRRDSHGSCFGRTHQFAL